MKVIRFSEISDSDREVQCPNGGFTSYRYLLERDGMGFTVTRTVIPPGGPQRWHYKNHLEACYCVSGRGLLVNESTQEYWAIDPGTLYALDRHDPHLFMAIDETVLVCVFNPPLKGREVHREDGSYE